MNDPIDPAIVAAAQAIDWGTHEYRVGSPDWRVPSCRCGWKASAPYAVSEFDLHIAELALEAAAPLIAAKALREAADDDEFLAHLPEYASASFRRGAHYATGGLRGELRARADTLEAGQVEHPRTGDSDAK